MRTMRTITICLWVITMTNLSLGKGWRGIVPLHSTRTDVYRLLGSPDESGLFYDLKDEKVLIEYSHGQCESGQSLWNVPPDTVIRISVEPKIKSKISDLKLDKTKYREERDSHLQQILYYRNNEEGLSIEVNTDSGLVNAFTFFPAAKDDYLRCPATQENPDNVGEACSRKFNWYSVDALDEVNKHLDEFAVQLQYEDDAKGYIIAYDGQHVRTGEAKGWAERAKERLVNTRHIGAERIALIDGGHREIMTIELWIRPKGCRAPTISPTVDANQARNKENHEMNNKCLSSRPSRNKH